MTTAVLLFIAVGLASGLRAQEMPPRPVIVNVNESQPLAFGAFAPGLTGGTVTVGPDYSRSSTGDLVLLGMGYLYSPVMYYVRANTGTVVSILSTPPVTLTGSNGGTMMMQPWSSLPASPFVITVPWTEWTTVLVGGILMVNDIASNPPGDYTGSFSIIFIQE
ncbi:MAG: DUF4402 domain-containing protein [Bacteroidales bacterium]|nr:DUF4402 domain-containing protein [Bacteroidales bacterium]MDT8373717.1 DUF4402 domain-containing protein [Bacteroidales bacterium]